MNRFLVCMNPKGFQSLERMCGYDVRDRFMQSPLETEHVALDNT